MGALSVGRVLPRVLVFAIIRTFHERFISVFLELYFEADCLRMCLAPQHAQKYQKVSVLFWHPVCVQLLVPQG